MKTRNLSRDFFLFFTYGAMFFAVMSLCGCSSTPAARTQLQTKAETESAEMNILQEGIEAFSRGDYNTALDLFEALSRQTQNSVMLRRTLYGLACVKLAQAQEQNDLEEALLAWRRWINLKPKKTGFEDPLMITPFLEFIASSRLLTQANDSVDVDEAQTVEICKTALDRKQREALQIKSKYESKQKEVEFLRNRIEKLKGQINSLEKIHLEIQEKKKEVSSP